MLLKIHSDTGYNNSAKAQSRAGGHFVLGNSDNKPPLNNGVLLALAKIIKNVMASATEAELAAMFINCREAIPIRDTLKELGHPQPPTPVIKDNVIAKSIIDWTLKQNRSKAMDKCYYWLQDRADQKHFHFLWRPSKENLGDYYTKHHSTKHHIQQRPHYVHVDSPHG